MQLLQSHLAVQSLGPNLQNEPIFYGEGEYLFSHALLAIVSPRLPKHLPSTKLLTTTTHEWLFFRMSALMPLEMLQPAEAAWAKATLQVLGLLPPRTTGARADWLSSRCIIALHLSRYHKFFWDSITLWVPQDVWR